MGPTESSPFRPRETILIDLSVAIALRDPELSQALRTAMLSGVSAQEIMALIAHVSARARDPRLAIHATAAALELAEGGDGGMQGPAADNGSSSTH